LEGGGNGVISNGRALPPKVKYPVQHRSKTGDLREKDLKTEGGDGFFKGQGRGAPKGGVIKRGKLTESNEEENSRKNHQKKGELEKSEKEEEKPLKRKLTSECIEEMQREK